jgi:hypothetical protein
MLAPEEATAAVVLATKESDKAAKEQSIRITSIGGAMWRRVKLAGRDVLGSKDPP